MTVIRVDFNDELGVPGPERQTCLWERFDPPERHAKPNAFVHPTLDRLLTSAVHELHPTAFLLARALATFMREDKDRHTFFAYPSRECILERAGLSSMTTFKRHMPDVLRHFGIKTRRRMHSSNVYTWHPQSNVSDGPPYGPSGHVTGSRRGPSNGPPYGPTDGPRYGPLTGHKQEQDPNAPQQTATEASARAWSCPTIRHLMEAAGYQNYETLQARIEKDIRVLGQFPRWIASLERKLSNLNLTERPSAPVEVSLADTINLHPSPERVQEIESLLAGTEPTRERSGLSASEEEQNENAG